MELNYWEILSAFIVLFAVIDILGSIPIIVSMQERGDNINAFKTSSVAFGLLVLFMYLGEAMLSLFGVDVNSFAVAGSIILFALGFEMVLGLQIFKQDAPEGASIVPLAFPLLAGPGTFTTLIALRAEYAAINILIALCINIIIVYVSIRLSTRLSRLLGQGGMYVIKKFAGVILLAIAVRLFTSNLSSLLEQLNK